MTNNIFAKVILCKDQVYDPSGYNQVIINKGSNANIKKGQRFIVYDIGEELFDPDTNESLGKLEIVRGTGIATHVQEKITTITTDNYKKIPRRIPQSSLYNIIVGISSKPDKDYVEEYAEKKIPFIDVKKGDFVRPIS